MLNELEQLNLLLEEFKKRQEHSFIKYIPDDHPERNQKLFHEQTQWCRLVFGGNRSGKSRCAAQEIAYILTNTSPYQKHMSPARVWIISVEYRTIYEGIWSHLKNALPYWEIKKMGPKVPSGHDIPTYIEMKNGSRADFISAIGGENTRQKLQSAEIDYLFIDEEIDGTLWDELQMRLLTRNGRVVISATLIQSEDWLIELEKQAQFPNKNVGLVRLNTKYNKFNNAEALQRILGRLSPEEQEIRILGKSRQLTGLVFNTWNNKHEIEPFEIPKHWPRIMAFDAGFRTAAALWVAITPENKLIAYREMYLHEATLDMIVEFFYAAEQWLYDEKTKLWNENPNENIIMRLIDPSALRKLEDGSIGVGVQLSNYYNIHFVPALNDWRYGVEAARRLLMPDITGDPHFKVFNNLENFLTERAKYRTIPKREDRNKDQAPDRPLSRFDHLMDCFRYIASSEIQYSHGKSIEEQLDEDALNINNLDNLTHERKMRLLHRRMNIIKRMINGSN